MLVIAGKNTLCIVPAGITRVQTRVLDEVPARHSANTKLGRKNELQLIESWGLSSP